MRSTVRFATGNWAWSHDPPGSVGANTTPGKAPLRFLDRSAQALLLLLVVLQFFEHIRFLPFTITQALGFGLAGVFVLKSSLWRRPERVFLCLLGFWVVFSFSTLLYLHEVPTVATEAAVRKILTLGQSVSLYYFAYCLFRREQTRRMFPVAVFLGALTISCLAIGGIGLTERAKGRLSFAELDENATASLAGLGVVSGASLLARRRSWFQKAAAIAGLAPMIWFVSNTGSRGGMLAMGAGLVALFGSARKVGYWVLGALVMSLLWWQIENTEIASTRWGRTIETGDTADRVDIILDSWEQFKERPILGRGDVNSNYDLGSRRGVLEVGPHNEIVWVLTSTGLIGALFASGAAARLLRGIWANRGEWEQGLPQGYLVALGVTCMSVEFHHRKLMWVVLAYLVTGVAGSWKQVPGRLTASWSQTGIANPGERDGNSHSRSARPGRESLVSGETKGVSRGGKRVA